MCLYIHCNIHLTASYAQTLIFMKLIIVILVGFLVITRLHDGVKRCNKERIIAQSVPDLPIPTRTVNSGDGGGGASHGWLTAGESTPPTGPKGRPPNLRSPKAPVEVHTGHTPWGKEPSKYKVPNSRPRGTPGNSILPKGPPSGAETV